MTDQQPQQPVQLTNDQFQQLLGMVVSGNRDTQDGASVKLSERPTIDIEATEGEWVVFADSWSRYKRMAKLTAVVAVKDHLRQTCSQQLNKRLFDLMGPDALNAATEDVLLAWIKDIVVRGVHAEVHRTRFVNLHQKQGESVKSFASRLKAEGSLCNFRINAPDNCADVNCHCANHGIGVTYEDDMMSTQIVSGSYNKEHQAKVLAESSTLLTLDAKLNRLVALEQSESSLSHLHADAAVASVNAVKGFKFVKKNKYPPKTRTSSNTNFNQSKCVDCNKIHETCSNCGGQHKCTTRCNNCKVLGHIKVCCRKNAFKSSVVTLVEKEEDDKADEGFSFGYEVMVSRIDIEEPVEDEACCLPVTPEVSASGKGDTVHHMEWDKDKFLKRNPQSAPVLKVYCKFIHNIQKDRTFEMQDSMNQKPNIVNCVALADTGAQICTAGINLMSALGIDETYLLPTSMKIKGVTTTAMSVLGTMILNISAGGKYTNQMVYIASEARKLILSEKALHDLGVIPQTFPVANIFPVNIENVKIINGKANCGCWLRGDVPELPSTISFKPVEANREKLENWVLQRYASTAFNTCQHQNIPKMTGPEMEIRTHEGTTPVAVHSPIPVPHHWKRQVKEGLNADCRLGVIEPVPANTPTTWCSRMVVVTKPDGSPRRVVDLQKLNSVTIRETHHTPSPWNQACVIPPNTKKTILDAWNGFHSIPLTKESREKTTFITEWGRYRYRGCQGGSTTGDAYTKRFDDITDHVKQKNRCIDDSLLWEPDIELSFWSTLRYIDLCAKHGVVFNPKKFKFAMEELDFAGFTITKSCIKPTDNMLNTIKEFPVPTSLTAARSWFGLVNQVGYAFAQSNIMAPFRDLLKKNKKFYWDSALEELFIRSKKDIVDRIEKGVQMYEVGRPTCLLTDWSKTGIGYFLSQKHCHCNLEDGPNCSPGHWKIVVAGSRFCRDAETRYSPVEGECLAVVYGLEQTRMFTLGCPNLIVAVDHKPLVPILNDKSLDQIKNPRLLNLKEKTLMFNFKTKHIPGSLHCAPDATSRSPVGDYFPSPDAKQFLLQCFSHDQCLDEVDINHGLIAAVKASCKDLDYEVVSWDKVVEESRKDDMSMSPSRAIQDGFPDKKEKSPECLRKFYQMKDDLHSINGVPFLGDRMFIPQSLRRSVLNILHSANQGVTGMKAAARGRFWLPGMDTDIEQKRAQCRTCIGMAPSNIRLPMAEPPEPEYPWQYAVMDYFDLSGVPYLVAADRYTGWPEVHQVDGKATTLIRICRNMFSQYGVPEEIASDGGPPFQSYEWKQFLKQWGIHQRISSANYPQSNGRAELAVKSCKRMLRENTGKSGCLGTTSVVKALLQYRNTPLSGIGMSPSYMLYGRQMRDALPSVPNKWRSITMCYNEKYGGPISKVWEDIKICREIAAARKLQSSLENYDIHKRPLSCLSVGDYVAIQNRNGPNPLRWDKTGRIVERLANRQYMAKADGSGRVLLRTRCHLRKINSPSEDRSAYDLDKFVGIAPGKISNEPDIPLFVPGTLSNGADILEPVDPANSTSSKNPTSSESTNETTDDIWCGTETPRRNIMPSYDAPVEAFERNSRSVHRTSNPDTPLQVSTDAIPLRRGSRQRKATRKLSPSMHGKYHDEI